MMNDDSYQVRRKDFFPGVGMVDFPEVAKKIFPRGIKCVVKFHLTHSKLYETTCFF